MATDYGGVVALSQSVLAINLAYIALDRFRYKSEIRNMFQQAQSAIEGMPTEYQNDLAWKNIESIASGDGPQSWSSGRLGYWCYTYLFQKATDRVSCYVFALFAVFTMIFYAYRDLFPAAAPAEVSPAGGEFLGILVSLAALAFLILGILVPTLFVLAGRYTLACARRSMADNLAHLGERFRNEVGEDISEKLREWGLDE